MLDQVREHPGDMIKLVVQFVKIRLPHIALIQRHVCMTLQFRGRRLRNKQKLPKFLTPFSRKAFRNVGHDGYAGTPHLIFQAVVFCELAVGRQPVN